MFESAVSGMSDDSSTAEGSLLRVWLISKSRGKGNKKQKEKRRETFGFQNKQPQHHQPSIPAHPMVRIPMTAGLC
jgi:hypothetical protein